MANNDDIVKLTLANTGTSNPERFLGDIDSVLNKLEKTIKSASNSFEHFNATQKYVDPSGMFMQDVFVKKSDLPNILKAVNDFSFKQAQAYKASGKMSSSDPDFYLQANTSEQAYVKYHRAIMGKQAQAMARQEASNLGGYAENDLKNKDKMYLYVPVDSSYVPSNAKQKNALYKQSFPETENLSRLARSEQQQKDKEEAVKEQEKQAQKERDKEQREREKQARDEARVANTIAKSILAGIVLIADITRRILTSALAQIAKTETTYTTGHNVGLSVPQMRAYSIFEKAKGLPQGTVVGAEEAIQSKYGNIQSLDDNSLKPLAPVMGNNIEKLVLLGRGQSTPDEILRLILNDFLKQYLAGKDNNGTFVGREKAGRNLKSVLDLVDPNISALFAKMISDSASGYYGDFSSFEEWLNKTETNRTDLADNAQKYATELSKTYNEILSMVEDLKTSFFTRLVISMDDLLSKVKNLRIGMPPEKSLELDSVNRQKNKETIAKMEANSKTLLWSLPAESVYRNKGFNYDKDVLFDIATGKLNKETLTKNIGSYASYFGSKTEDIEKYKRDYPKQFSQMVDSFLGEEYLKAQVALMGKFSNEELQTFASAITEARIAQKAKEANKKESNVQEVTATPALESVETNALMQRFRQLAFDWYTAGSILVNPDVDYKTERNWSDLSPKAQELYIRAISAYRTDMEGVAGADRFIMNPSNSPENIFNSKTAVGAMSRSSVLDKYIQSEINKDMPYNALTDTGTALNLAYKVLKDLGDNVKRVDITGENSPTGTYTLIIQPLDSKGNKLPATTLETSDFVSNSRGTMSLYRNGDSFVNFNNAK